MLNLTSNGLLFSEDFASQNPLWIITPNIEEAYEYLDNCVRLKAIDSKVCLSINLPSEDYYMIDAEINHNPKYEFDLAGLIIMSSTDNNIEIQNYYDGNNLSKGDFKYIRIMYENSSFTFFASRDKTIWNEVGNATLVNANRIGFFH